MTFPGGIQEEFQRFESLIADAILRVGRSGRLILSSEVESFQLEFAAWLGVSGVVGVASGTDALTLILKALDIGVGDEVVIPATATPTLFGVARTGATVRFADIDPLSLSVTPTTVSRVLSKRTRAVVIVHLYGQPIDVRPFDDLLRGRGIEIIEDCAQAHGARLGNDSVGIHSHASAWSFYPTKNLGAMGDAGAVASNDGDLLARVSRLRQYGETERYSAAELGFNSRLDELQAAILRIKLHHLHDMIAARRTAAQLYCDGLRESLFVLDEQPRTVNSRHLFPIRVENRDRVLARLKARGIPAGCHYPLPANLQPCVTGRGASDHCRNAEDLSKNVLTLPMHPYLSEDHVREVIGCVLDEHASRDGERSA